MFLVREKHVPLTVIRYYLEKGFKGEKVIIPRKVLETLQKYIEDMLVSLGEKIFRVLAKSGRKRVDPIVLRECLLEWTNVL